MPASRQAIVGVFLAGGLLLFAAGLFWIGDRRQLFANNMQLYTEFANVSGLAIGAKVRVAGVDAGEVQEIIVPASPEAHFRIRFRVLKTFLPILRKDSAVSIQNDGLLGSKFLQVNAGSNVSSAITEGDTIPGVEPVEISDLLTQASTTIQTANDAVLDVRNGISQTVEAILDINRQTTDVIKDAGTQVGKLTAAGNQMAGEVTMMITNVRNGQGTIGRLLTDDSLYEKFRTMADDGQQTVREGQQLVRNVRSMSENLQAISEEVRSRDLGAKFSAVADSAETLTHEATLAVRSLKGDDDSSGGLMADVRQTLTSANNAMANLAENTEALKRNFFFRGFFNNRGFYDLDAVTVREYNDGKFLSDRQKVTEWLEAQDIFMAAPDGKERLSDEGRNKLDLAMAGFLRYSKNDPFIVEAWAGPGTDPQTVLLSRERAIMVSEYLVKKFELKPNYVAIMPMNAAMPPNVPARDGIGLVLFAPKSK